MSHLDQILERLKRERGECAVVAGSLPHRSGDIHVICPRKNFNRLLSDFEKAVRALQDCSHEPSVGKYCDRVLADIAKGAE